jgi:hypothetical protein
MRSGIAVDQRRRGERRGPAEPGAK